MPTNAWSRRIERAERIADERLSAREVLRFLAAILRFQARVSQWLGDAHIPAETLSFDGPVWPGLASQFPDLLREVAKHGPPPLGEAAGEMREGNTEDRVEILSTFWTSKLDVEPATPAESLCARALLEPYAEFVRVRIATKTLPHTPCLCPYCGAKPGAGVLRPLGDGGQRFLMCSLCMAEWEFRRIVCPACGEENHAKLPVYSAEEFNYIRVDACDTCKTYLKTVDMTKNGIAEPMVDEIAAIPLDLWAQKQGYSKLLLNLMQL